MFNMGRMPLEFYNVLKSKNITEVRLIIYNYLDYFGQYNLSFLN